MELVYRGAEAELWKDEWLGIPCIRKIRIRKEYRDPRLDEKIVKSRVKTEAKMLVKARKAVNTPHVLDIDWEKNELVLEYITGEKVRDILYRKESIDKLGFEMGKAVKALHDLGIIHNDLTTSNFIWNGKLWMIDFGLAESSNRLEDKATDLVVFKRMLKASHWEIFQDVWNAFLEGYEPNNEVLKKTEEIEKRAKYMR